MPISVQLFAAPVGRFVMLERLRGVVAVDQMDIVSVDFPFSITPLITGAMDPRVQLVVKLLEAEPTRAFSVAELCDRFYMSSSHLQHLFKRDVHMSIREFILRTRLRAAAMMIGTTGERIRQISFAAGFRDISNFNHAFKRQFGISPREYRMRSILANDPSKQSGDRGFDQ